MRQAKKIVILWLMNVIKSRLRCNKLSIQLSTQFIYHGSFRRFNHIDYIRHHPQTALWHDWHQKNTFNCIKPTDPGSYWCWPRSKVDWIRQTILVSTTSVWSCMGTFQYNFRYNLPISKYHRSGRNSCLCWSSPLKKHGRCLTSYLGDWEYFIWLRFLSR